LAEFNSEGKLRVLTELAQEILRDRSLWANDQGWVRRDDFIMRLYLKIDPVLACREREKDRQSRGREMPDEPLHVKIDLGRKRVIHILEQRIKREYDQANGLLRLPHGKEASGRRGRKGKLITCWGVTRAIRDWAAQQNIQPGTISKRLRDGWSVEEALTRPLKECMVSPGNLAHLYPTEWSTSAQIAEILRPNVPVQTAIEVFKQRRKHEGAVRDCTLSDEDMVESGLLHLVQRINQILRARGEFDSKKENDVPMYRRISPQVLQREAV